MKFIVKNNQEHFQKLFSKNFQVDQLTKSTGPYVLINRTLFMRAYTADESFELLENKKTNTVL